MRVFVRFGVIGVATIGLGATPALANEVTVGATKDNTLIFSDDGTPNSNGIGPQIFSGLTGPFAENAILRAVIAFDLSAIPAGATIDAVEMTLNFEQGSAMNPSDQIHTLHALSADWGEGTSLAFGGAGAAATTGDATWVHTFFPDQFWTTPGGDFAATASASAVVGTVPGTAVTWGSTAAMVADVQAWVDDPSSNYGWVIRGNEGESNSAKRFSSRDTGDPALLPQLRVVFTPACPGDFNGNGSVDFGDLTLLLSTWGCSGCVTDVNRDGEVGFQDLLAVLAAWGPCV